MATPGQVVGKARLLREVWRLHHVPETNSLAVHACRLRNKLTSAGLAHTIVTVQDGYSFRGKASALPLHSGVDILDAYLRLTLDPLLYETVRS
jgi:DNA-binding winged helix-turn-helix (wHTH) protein